MEEIEEEGERVAGKETNKQSSRKEVGKKQQRSKLETNDTILYCAASYCISSHRKSSHTPSEDLRIVRNRDNHAVKEIETLIRGEERENGE